MSRKRDKKSPAWHFFKETGDGFVECRCSKRLKFTGSTTGMKDHAETEHEEELKKFMMKKKHDTSTIMDSGVRNVSQTGAEKQLILALSTSNVPFRFVKNESFVKFCHLLNSDFKLISPDSIRRRLAVNAEEYVENVKKKLKSLDVGLQKCYLTFDGWEGPYESVGLYALFVYFIDDKFEKHKLFLGIRHLEGPATHQKVGNLITDILREYGLSLDVVLGAVCDAASNLTSFLNKNYLYHLHCCAHSLSLIIHNAAEISSVKEMLKKVNSLAAHLSRSKTEKQAFMRRSNALKIPGRLPLPFSVTRWGGAVLMAKCYQLHYESISSLTRFQDYLMSDSEKAILNEFVELTSPYLEAIHSAEKNENFCSEIIIQYASLYNFISQKDARKPLVRALKTETLDRFLIYLENDAARISTMLDPRFSFLDGILLGIPWEDLEKLTENYCDSYIILDPATDADTSSEPSNNCSTMSVFASFIESKRQSTASQSVKSEMIAYKAFVLSSRPPMDSSPLNFWHLHRQKFPNLARAARHFLASPQSSAQVERLFSRCGDIVSSSRRNRLSHRTLNNLLLNSFLCLMEKEKQGDETEEESDESDQEETGGIGIWNSNVSKHRSASVSNRTPPPY